MSFWVTKEDEMTEKRVFWWIFLKNGPILVPDYAPEAMNCIDLVNYHWSQPLLPRMNLKNSSTLIFGRQDNRKWPKIAFLGNFLQKSPVFSVTEPQIVSTTMESCLKPLVVFTDDEEKENRSTWCISVTLNWAFNTLPFLAPYTFQYKSGIYSNSTP